jgi:molybdopterin converting factor subunit 1
MIKLLFFGITQDLVENHVVNLAFDKTITVRDLKSTLFLNYPSLHKFPNFAVAVNENYATEDTLINDKDVVAIIPPVSGG